MLKSKLLLIATLCTLTACSTAREELGLNRQSPDEFSVLKRAPLTLPPSYTLRPPSSGEVNVASDNAQTQAKRVILGQDTASNTAPSSTSTGTQMFLNQAGADKANPEIRSTLDRETAVLSTTNKTVAEKLLFWTGDENAPMTTEADKLDASAEAERLNDQGITAPTPGEKRAPNMSSQ